MKENGLQQDYVCKVTMVVRDSYAPLNTAKEID